MKKLKIDAKGLSFRELNKLIRQKVCDGAQELDVVNVNGQRYIGGGLRGDVILRLYGSAGNDIGVFMDGPTIIVYGNTGDGVGNTMNRGKIVIYGSSGDIVGYSMRGGKIYIRGNAGYRVGIHMKEYGNNYPVIVVGGSVRDFLGEYMAGGRLIVLGLNSDEEIVGDFIGAGIHGGKIFIRTSDRDLIKQRLGWGAAVEAINDNDRRELEEILTEYCKNFNYTLHEILESDFVKVVPRSHRPYGKLYMVSTE